MTRYKSPDEMSDDELIANLQDLVKEQQALTMQALADVHAGKSVDPFTLDLLRDYLEEEEVEELEALNRERLQRAR